MSFTVAAVEVSTALVPASMTSDVVETVLLTEFAATWSEDCASVLMTVAEVFASSVSVATWVSFDETPNVFASSSQPP
jgi:hypothetical protein